MRNKQLSFILVLVFSSSTIGGTVIQHDQKHTSSVDWREDIEVGQDILEKNEGYLKFNGRSVGSNNNGYLNINHDHNNIEDTVSSSHTSTDNMVEKGLDDSDSPRWSLPSFSTVQEWASTAYSQLPSYQTVASYVPEPFQQYLPSQETVESYVPSVESIRTKLYIPLEYVRRRIFGGFRPQKLLTENERDRLIQALSDKLQNKQGGENVQALISELGEKIAHRAEDNMTPIVIRLVVHRVVYAMAVSYVGPLVAFFVREHIDSLADTVADQAVAQYYKAGPSRIDLYSYMKLINWRAIFNKVIGIIQTYRDETEAQ